MRAQPEKKDKKKGEREEEEEEGGEKYLQHARALEKRYKAVIMPENEKWNKVVGSQRSRGRN